MGLNEGNGVPESFFEGEGGYPAKTRETGRVSCDEPGLVASSRARAEAQKLAVEWFDQHLKP